MKKIMLVMLFFIFMHIILFKRKKVMEIVLRWRLQYLIGMTLYLYNIIIYHRFITFLYQLISIDDKFMMTIKPSK